MGTRSVWDEHWDWDGVGTRTGIGCYGIGTGIGMERALGLIWDGY